MKAALMPRDESAGRARRRLEVAQIGFSGFQNSVQRLGTDWLAVFADGFGRGEKRAGHNGVGSGKGESALSVERGRRGRCPGHRRESELRSQAAVVAGEKLFELVEPVIQRALLLEGKPRAGRGGPQSIGERSQSLKDCLRVRQAGRNQSRGV